MILRNSDGSNRTWTLGLRITEGLLLALVAGALAWFGYRHGGQVFGTDTLYYIDVGLRGVADPFILNRYTNVYLLRLFTALAPDPISGLRMYSGLVLALSTCLVYFSARLLSTKSSPLNGVVAAGLFLGSAAVVERIMAPLVDTTVMLVFLVLVVVYVMATRRRQPSPWLLGLFGLLLFAALRAKELSIVTLVLLPGLVLAFGDGSNWRSRLRPLRFVLLGGLAGAMLQIVVNTIVVGEPLFGFRPADVRAYLEIWSTNLGQAPGPGSTFTELIFGRTGIIFSLYLAAVLLRRKLPLHTRLLWTLPLLLAAMAVLLSTRQGWVIVERGFLPALALMTILASQIVVVPQVTLADLGRAAPALAAALLVIFGLAFVGLTAEEAAFPQYFAAVFAPLSLSAILLLLFISPDQRRIGLALALLLLPLSLYPVRLNLLRVDAEPELTRLNVRFQPIEAFQDSLRSAFDLEMYVSSSVLPFMGIKENPDELAALVNTALGTSSTRHDYTLGTPDERLLEDLEQGQYTHVLLSSSEWDWMRTGPRDRPEWRQRYRALTEPTGRFVLLKRMQPGSG